MENCSEESKEIKAYFNKKMIVLEEAKKIVRIIELCDGWDKKVIKINGQKDVFDNISKGVYIYMLSISKSADMDAVIKAFRNRKKKRKEKLPKINISSSDKVLYVGSCDNIKKRLKEHFGFCKKNSSTYALWLNEWYPNRQDDTITVTLYPVSTTEKHKELEGEIACTIEEYFWKTLQPRLGKCPFKTK